MSWHAVLRVGALAGLAVTLLAMSMVAAPGPIAAQDEEDGVSSLETRGWRTDFSVASVLLEEIVPGGPPRDGIPSIDAPRFESIEMARTWLAGKAPVIALEIDGHARAYPLAILSWHEIVNDSLGGVPVVVTFCPLCNTALVFERTLDGRDLEFGTTGNLRFSDLVMYDRQTESWWQQATGHAIVGELTGSRLRFLAAQLIGLDQFAAAWPDGDVLGRDTGYDRRYGDNPYTGFDSIDSRPFSSAGGDIDGIAPKERVVSVGEGSDGIAFPHSWLRTVGVAEAAVDGEPIVVFWAPLGDAGPGAVSIAVRDIGSTGVFSPMVDGRQLTFVRAGGEGGPITDVETGSTWTVTGHAIDGPLLGAALRPVVHADHFWFAWAAFVPDTRIWTPPDEGPRKGPATRSAGG